MLYHGYNKPDEKESIVGDDSKQRQFKNPAFTIYMIKVDDHWNHFSVDVQQLPFLPPKAPSQIQAFFLNLLLKQRLFEKEEKFRFHWGTVFREGLFCFFLSTQISDCDYKLKNLQLK